MTRHVKTLGLAIVAALALTAMTAPAASAELYDFKSEVETTTLKAEQVGTSVMEVSSGLIECGGGEASGTMSSELKAAVELKLIPTYSGCEMFGLSAEVHANGCGYVIAAVAKEGSNYEAQTGVQCEEPENSIEFIAKSGGVTVCTVYVGQQVDLKDVTVKEEGSCRDRGHCEPDRCPLSPKWQLRLPE